MQERLDAGFERAVDVLFGCKGRVVVTGMGKSGLIGRKIAATLSSTGTPSVFLHPAEALHGDLGMLQAGDTVLAISYGGETEEIVALLATMKRLGLPLVTFTGNTRSTLAQASDVTLDTSVREEACSLNLAPTASTTAAMALGDALAVSLLERRGFGHDDFAALHPGGRLGKKLLRVRELDARRRGAAAGGAEREHAGRDLRNQPQRPGNDHGDGCGRRAGGHHHRRRFAAADAAAAGRGLGAHRRRVRDGESGDHRAGRVRQRARCG